MTGVNGFLVTGPQDPRMQLWGATCTVANWLGARFDTWHVMVMDEHSDAFLTAAAQLGMTVQLIESSGDNETWKLLVGKEGTGWTWELAARHAAQELQEEQEYRATLIEALLDRAPEEWLDDDEMATGDAAIAYVRHLEALADGHGLNRQPPPLWPKSGP